MVAVVLLLLLGGVQGSWPPEGQVELLHDQQLEASMHSAVISELQEAVAAAEAVATAATQGAGFPDSSAVVGRVFQMHVPIKTAGDAVGAAVKVSKDGGRPGISKELLNCQSQFVFNTLL